MGNCCQNQQSIIIYKLFHSCDIGKRIEQFKVEYTKRI